jgi:hypothetical protein
MVIAHPIRSRGGSCSTRSPKSCTTRGHRLKYPYTLTGGMRRSTDAASMSRSSTISGVQSAIVCLPRLAIEPLAQLPHELALRPGEPLIVGGDDQHAFARKR